MSSQTSGSSVKKTLLGSRLADLSYTCPRELERIGANPGWLTPGYATALS